MNVLDLPSISDGTVFWDDSFLPTTILPYFQYSDDELDYELTESVDLAVGNQREKQEVFHHLM
jgi:hypothetical protein